MCTPREESVIINAISDNLTNLMIKNNLNAPQLAKKLGVSVSTVKRIKLGYNTTTILTIIRICDLFDVSLSWLIGGKN